MNHGIDNALQQTKEAMLCKQLYSFWHVWLVHINKHNTDIKYGAAKGGMQMKPMQLFSKHT